jgi:ribonuclease BN (tRNA processing enzyme)
VKLIVTGSADAFNAAGRGHSCYWLEGAAKDPLMVDFGATALLALRRFELDPHRLRTVLVTHLHGDHVAGLPFLIIDGMFNRLRRAPLRLIGPPGTGERVEGLLRLCYGSAAETDRPFEIELTEVEPGDEVQLEGATVQALRAEHGSGPDQPLGYRLRGEAGRCVVFSGDTAMTDELLRAAHGADLLVAECSALDDPGSGHCSWTQWCRVLPELDTGRVILSHLPAEVRAEAPRSMPDGGPPVQLADDGLVVEVSPG